MFVLSCFHKIYSKFKSTLGEKSCPSMNIWDDHKLCVTSETTHKCGIKGEIKPKTADTMSVTFTLSEKTGLRLRITLLFKYVAQTRNLVPAAVVTLVLDKWNIGSHTKTTVLLYRKYAIHTYIYNILQCALGPFQKMTLQGFAFYRFLFYANILWKCDYLCLHIASSYPWHVTLTNSPSIYIHAMNAFVSCTLYLALACCALSLHVCSFVCRTSSGAALVNSCHSSSDCRFKSSSLQQHNSHLRRRETMLAACP